MRVCHVLHLTSIGVPMDQFMYFVSLSLFIISDHLIAHHMKDVGMSNLRPAYDMMLGSIKKKVQNESNGIGHISAIRSIA